MARGDGGFPGQEVVDGLDDEHVDAALEQGEGELLVARREVVVGDLPEGGELGARSDRTRDEAGTRGTRVTVRHTARDLR